MFSIRCIPHTLDPSVKCYVVTYPPDPLSLGIDKGKGVKRKRDFASLRRSFYLLARFFAGEGEEIREGLALLLLAHSL